MDSERVEAVAGAVESGRSAFDGLSEHWQIASRAIDRLARDDRVLGLYLAGSFAGGRPDRWSDIDLYIIASDRPVDELISTHERLRGEVGDIIASFPATHLHDPRQIITFYRASEPIHVDYQYRGLLELTPRHSDRKAVILLDRNGELDRWREACRGEPPPVSLSAERLQYLEDRFWAWCWYAHAKIERGELWEAREAVEYLRSHVIVPLAHREGQLFEGNRRLEEKLVADVRELLVRTIPPTHTAGGYRQALSRMMDAYAQLFRSLPADARDKVQLADRDYFRKAIDDSTEGTDAEPDV